MLAELMAPRMVLLMEQRKLLRMMLVLPMERTMVPGVWRVLLLRAMQAQE